MTRSMANALKSVVVLVCITVVCVGLLAVCNMFFPKYVPVLDTATAGLINKISPTGVGDEQAFNDGYIVMLYEDEYGVTLADYNKTNKSSKAEILAVYGHVKGDSLGVYVVESSSHGKDSDVVVLTAYSGDVIVGATVKKQGESYWRDDLEALFDTLKGQSGEVDLVAVSGVTISSNAIKNAVNLSNAFAKASGSKIAEVISSKGGAAND